MLQFGHLDWFREGIERVKHRLRPTGGGGGGCPKAEHLSQMASKRYLARHKRSSVACTGPGNKGITASEQTRRAQKQREDLDTPPQLKADGAHAPFSKHPLTLGLAILPGLWLSQGIKRGLNPGPVVQATKGERLPPRCSPWDMPSNPLPLAHVPPATAAQRSHCCLGKQQN